MSYHIVRFTQYGPEFGRDTMSTTRRVIVRGLTLEEAQAHCSDKETSSRTCEGKDAKYRCKRLGCSAWFDGYDETK